MVYISIILFIIFMDLSSKKYITEYLKVNSFKRITKHFYLNLVVNRGAFLGFLKNRQRLLKTIIALFLLILLGVLIFYNQNNAEPRMLLALSFIIGGASGNFVDRIYNGYVTDFLYIKYKKLPVFNIADIFIFLGAILLML
ncbi:signal peptidase II [Alkalibaculum bacchi]|uniref:signal peptidase II n=1 Tax=Alkalibaculum bacchi TaxID=645887 RepID=UPI0026E9ABBD|nr:signal peptidase II [Alkalibaculum bacchi]